VVALALGGGVVGAMQLVNRADRNEPGGGGSGVVASTSTSTSPATGAALPRCTSGQVRVDASLGGAMGSVEGAILVSNYSSTRCTLQGYPGVTLLGADLSPVAGPNGYKVRKTAPQWQADALPEPAGWPVVTLKPGAVASIRFRWSNWCGTGNATTPLWKIRLPGSGEAPVYGMDGTQAPSCNGPGLASTIWIGPFEPAKVLPR
ncbi:MAG: DUF4232 domain-containing protein, partial [Actinomycetota bacterium]